MTIRNSYKDHLPLIGLIIFAFLFACMGEWRPFFFDIDEPKYITAALEMFRSGDWLHPMFNGLPRMEKPPLPYWMAVPALKMFGASFSNGTLLFITRIPAILSSVLTVTATYLIGKRLYSAKVGLLAALLLLIAPTFKIEGMMLKADIIYTAAVTWATYFYLRRFQGNRGIANLLGATIALSFGVLTKGPFALPPLAGYLMAELLRDRPCKSYVNTFIKSAVPTLRKESLTITLGIILGCGPFLLWIWSASSPGMNYLSGMLGDAAENTAHKGSLIFFYLGSLGFYSYEAIILFFPLGSFSLGAIHNLLKYGPDKFKEKNIIVWTSIFYLLLSIFVYRLRAHRYFLPILPLLSVVTVNWLLTATRDKMFKRLFVLGNVIIAGTAIFIGTAVLATGEISVNLWKNVPVTNFSSELLPFAISTFAVAALMIFSAIRNYRKPMAFLSIAFLALLAIYPLYFNAAPRINSENKFQPTPLIAVNLAEMIKKDLSADCLFIISEHTMHTNPGLSFFLRNAINSSNGKYLATLPFDVQKFNDMIMAPVVSRQILKNKYPHAEHTPLYKFIDKSKFRKSVLILSGAELTQLYRNSIYLNKIFGSPAASIPIQGANVSWDYELFYVVFMKGF
ncbi:glycosyltransferase family 39 protein [Desulfovibrio gilichinskyi]|uniref:4-amino-4-deoxy-L-arabinose transferase n=1 Tax=Desulfovibrio gilichinskyi TaxID=1519643 RepID=A0A1X7DII4_9BACT|nr:glycosyltransferase family 39 protein [Desulfovibrio gilichinskyi]SMF16153.1 4-amino-4-deoxy-L-arabinose transferase [Desulfovibrio gilichinskyi]